MKALWLVLFLVPASAFSMSVENPRLVRVLDGHVVYCKETYEANRTTFFTEIDSATADDSSFDLSLNVNYAICVREGDKLSFASRSPLDPIVHQDELGNLIRIEFRDPELYLGTPGFQPLGLVQVGNSTRQSVSFHVELAKALSPAQLKDLALGKPVDVKLVLIGRTIASSVKDGVSTPLGQLQEGQFSVLFTLRK